MQVFIKQLKFFLITLFFTTLFSVNTHAQVIDLVEFIAGENFADHALSTGEYVYFTDEGGDSSGDIAGARPVRQYKNSNWEQFYIGTDWIYRREDTSWAPQGATDPSGDATCQNGSKAIYTLDIPNQTYSPGQNPSSDGKGWAPARGTAFNTPSGSWNQQSHTIMPIDAGVDPGTYGGYPINSRSDLRYCDIAAPPNYPATDAPGLTITGYFEADQFTFCSGVTNPEPVVILSGTHGAGSNDGFIYMRNCGLAGFSDSTLNVGIIEGCGVTPADPNDPDYDCSNYQAPTAIPRTIEGIIKSNIPEIVDVPLPNGDIITTKKTNIPLENVNITAFAGDYLGQSTSSGKRGGELTNIADTAFSNKNGYFKIDTELSIDTFEGSNYVAFSCNGSLVDLYKIDLRRSDYNSPFEFVLDCAPGSLSPLQLAVYHYVDRLNIMSLFEENKFSVVDGLFFDLLALVQLECTDCDTGYIGANLPDTIAEFEQFEEDRDPTAFCDPNAGRGDPNQCPPQQQLSLAQEDLETRAAPNEATDFTAFFHIVCMLAGCGPNKATTPPRESNGEEDLYQLPLCSTYIECDRPITTDPNTDFNSQNCYGISNELGSPGEPRRRYQAASKETPVCILNPGDDEINNSVTLDEIQPPWAGPNDNGEDCRAARESGGTNPFPVGGTGYQLDCRFFPHELTMVPGDQNKTFETGKQHQVTNDSQESDPRERQAIREDIAHQPFKDRNTSIYTSDVQGRYSYAKTNILMTDSTVSSPFGGPAVNVIKTPFQQHYVGDSTTASTDVRPPKNNGVFYKIGVQQISPTFNENDRGRDAMFNLAHLGQLEGHLWSSGAEFVPSGVSDQIYYGYSFLGQIYNFVVRAFDALFDIFLGNISLGGTCSPLGYTAPSLNNCFNDPNAVDCEVSSCQASDGLTGDQGSCSALIGQGESTLCEPSGSGYSGGSGNVNGINYSCFYRQRANPEDYGTDGASQCIGDYVHESESQIVVERGFGTEARNGMFITEAFAGPYFKLPEAGVPSDPLTVKSFMGCINTYDVNSTLETPEQTGLGSDFGRLWPCTFTPHADTMVRSVSDPVFEDPLLTSF